jgi:hypothetical protein
MFELLSRFDPGQLIGLTALKKTMLERGMSAEEIRMVMHAGPCTRPEHFERPAQPKQAAYSEI